MYFIHNKKSVQLHNKNSALWLYGKLVGALTITVNNNTKT